MGAFCMEQSEQWWKPGIVRDLWEVKVKVTGVTAKLLDAIHMDVERSRCQSSHERKRDQ